MGSGNTLISMSIALISLWMFQFPIAYVLSKHTSLGEVGIWWAFPISGVLATGIAVLWFAQGTWKKKRLVAGSKEDLQEKTLEESIVEEGIQ